ncbi:MAG: type II toxin-antitoxin system VapC family toxin [Microcystis sp. M114S2]|nr:type II toxin-antitoxin system VapC family toxin [Microcystis sp. M045S2]MCA2713594.1 type II toxin-antitoxin system VapC family toxin [Microcystis sp. M172S2]MCA2805239.1 type II toxin-antitoxin system VapC family toxin [Microcystis sp. M114S2]MCA2832759.1 type II toxin-antitoxin system VapC family toxin [Microcystis sp. M007S1]MCA2839149.1 type II toxin-antitoxin system VapC family toxin [Microcystis sp. M078S1]MCA2844009.1 type II toxin-antitoxin system VapC family toxin [Microcystis sp.
MFDTDHLSFIQRNGKEGKQILKKLATLDNPEVAVTIITYEEQVRGRLLFISKAKTVEQQILAYQGLEQLIIDYQSIVLIPFNQVAMLEYQRLRKLYPRLGKMELKIAAITLTNKGIFLTRNSTDFQQIDEFKIEDWSVT